MSSKTEGKYVNGRRHRNVTEKKKRTVSTTNSLSPFLSTLATIPRDSFSFSFSFNFSEARKASSDLIDISPWTTCFKHRSRRSVKMSSLVLGLLGGTGRGRRRLARRRSDLASTVDWKRTFSPSGSRNRRALSISQQSSDRLCRE